MLKYKNVLLMVDRCILKDVKVFKCFSMHLDVFVVYFIVLVEYFDAIQCIKLWYFSIYLKKIMV
jgi:hypothetical protein